jgi:ADP-ribose pyrophosphatase YjhB (NUDIX family)
MTNPRHSICVGTIVLEDNKCLLVRQASGASLAGRWSIPWGFVDDGETADVAAERETLEEAGVSVRVTGVVAVQTLPGAEGGIGLVFAAEAIDQGVPKPDGTETDEAMFLTAAEIRELPVEEWCGELALQTLAGALQSLAPADNPYDLPGWHS